MQKQFPSFRLLMASVSLFFSCAKQTAVPAGNNLSLDKNTADKTLKPVPAVVTYLTGDAADVTTTPTAGLVLMGGGTDVDAAIQWFLQRAGGGDVVVIRATGADGYNQYMYDMGGVNSV